MTLCDVYCEVPWISLCQSLGHERLPQVKNRLRLLLNCWRLSKAAITDSHRYLTPASLWYRFLISWTCTANTTATSAAVVLGLDIRKHVTTRLACLQDERDNVHLGNFRGTESRTGLFRCFHLNGFSLRFHPEANRQEDFYNIKNRQSITAYSLLLT